MRNERRLLSLFLFTGSLTLSLGPGSSALAQGPSRAVSVLTLLSADSVGVLVARDRVFIADPSLAPLSVCAGSRCAPVRASEVCGAPRCPGAGMLLTLERPIADVSELPTDREGFNRAMDTLRSDPALALIAWSFGVHPDPPPEPAHWVTRSRTDRVAWELGAYGVGGVLGATGVALAGGEVSGGFRFTWDPRTTDDDFLAIVFGNVLGLDLRVRVLELLPMQGASSWSATVGLAPAMGYGTAHESFRLPTFYSILLPEVGIALRESRDPTWYAGWSLPVTFLLDEHVGIEARASVMLVDEWIPGHDLEAIVTFGLGLVGR